MSFISSVRFISSWRSLMALSLAALLSGCAHTLSPDSSAKDQNWVQFSDSEAATITLANALEQSGYAISIINDQQIQVHYNRNSFTMEPRINPQGLSRIVVSQIYNIKPEHQDNPEIFIALSQLNTRLNCAKYLMLPGNEAAEVQSTMTFIHDRIEIEEIELFMAWMQSRIRQAGTLLPRDIIDMFEFEAID